MARGQDHDAHEHGDAAERIGQRHAAEAADGGEQDHGNAEEHEAEHVGVAGHGLEQLRTAHDCAIMVAPKNTTTMAADKFASAFDP